ncbi:DJ-1/PfpI family protein [Algoriphagus hitonicola]|uniref:DJ-1/PfpI family protein n=1 Tax=Algoriphagus hitonicola TaxID=435880 RepID=A0A1I2U1J9_9BACT|nr:DJ-1/PfpI family protein [Algoriphagus hitonicola]SFG68766.1 DJ-1/PfpI family protein [Algoriphagus hitonicola]
MKNLGIYIFDQVEPLDFIGPFEVFNSFADLFPEENMRVFTFSETILPIQTIGRLKVIPAHAFNELPAIDYLVIPGGNGSKLVIQNQASLERLNQLMEKSKWTMTVCSGARIPAKLGLLDDKPYCTHHQVYSDLKQLVKNGSPMPEKRFIESSRTLFTSAGVSAGIDLALHLIEKTWGKSHAKTVAEYMEYRSFEQNP